ncbi:MAG: hypothetical protein ACW98K_12835 [Candidatus Kariarchaeaceae archaeon]
MSKFSFVLTIFFIVLTATLPVVKGEQSTQTLFFNNYHDFSKLMGPSYHVEWSFVGDNSIIGINAMIVDQENFEKYTSGTSWDTNVLSDGTKTADSGTFNIPYADTWHVVFVNVDSDQQGTKITMTVNFITTATGNTGTTKNEQSEESRFSYTLIVPVVSLFLIVKIKKIVK